MTMIVLNSKLSCSNRLKCNKSTQNPNSRYYNSSSSKMNIYVSKLQYKPSYYYKSIYSPLRTVVLVARLPTVVRIPVVAIYNNTSPKYYHKHYNSQQLRLALVLHNNINKYLLCSNNRSKLNLDRPRLSMKSHRRLVASIATRRTSFSQ